MSISISEGGYTAVSSDSLRDAANRAVAVASLLRESVTSATRAGDNLDCMSVRLGVAEGVAQVGATSATLAQLIEVFAAQLVRAADVYEAAELLITTDLHGTSPTVEQRLAELEAAHPGVVDAARIFALAAGAHGFASMSAIPRSGIDVTIVDRRVSHTSNVAGVAPKGAADLVKTIPTGPAQIRVDRYNMPDGSQRFVVSVSGTRAVSSPSEPFDMNSNVALYTGKDAASAEAVRAALDDAGVEPGDWLLMNTHSQASMIADGLAPDPTVDPDMVVTWGNPGEQPMPADVVNIDIKHTNDPVGWLGGAEYPIPTGDEASFEVSRDTNAGRVGSAVSDAAGAHFLDAYVETGTMMDASDDPRMDALRDPLAELAEAESVTTTEYMIVESPPSMSLNPDVRHNPMPGGILGDGVAHVGSSESRVGSGFPSFDFADPQFEFADPSRPDWIGIAPPPEPGQPIFEFGEVPFPVSPESPVSPAPLIGADAPPSKEDNHVGPWRV